MCSEATMVQCHNRGCGKLFDPNNNPDDACCHHPGLPFFHDAYKGWSCCKKKYIDFTEFLNTKGCSYSKHSNIMPSVPEKPATKIDVDKEVVEVKPVVVPQAKRPPINTPLTTMKSDVAPSLKAIEASVVPKLPNIKAEDGDVVVGTLCKNSGCNTIYRDVYSNEEQCTYHSGSPIFHDGMKYWSCCQKKTTDFTSFLNQAGCQIGKHVWKKEEDNNQVVDCRWDWHQTPTHVVVAIYAKQYCPQTSTVQLNPIRLFANLIFPQQSYATFILDIELQGIINIEASNVSMYGTKVEIKLRKSEPGFWSKLDIPKLVTN